MNNDRQLNNFLTYENSSQYTSVFIYKLIVWVHNRRKFMLKGIALSVALLSSFVSAAIAGPFGSDPISSYLVEGKIIQPWKASVGNGLNWTIELDGQNAQTMRKNLVVKPTNKDSQDDALHLKWKWKVVKNEWGGNQLNDTSFTLKNHLIDLSSVSEAAALVLEIRLLRAPNENVFFSMQCQYKNDCAGKYPMKAALKRLPKKKWMYLPIPLACFNLDGNFDFSQVSTILSVATQGKLEFEVANIGLAPLPEGSKGCN